MNARWFEDLVRKWNPDITWTEDELGAVTVDLEGLCRLNSGSSFGEPPLSDNEARSWAFERVTGVLDGLARSYARYIARDEDARFAEVTTKDFDPGLPFVTARMHVPALNVNTASAAELEALPGLGPKTAAAIVRHRRQFGTFQSEDEVRRTIGLDAAASERLWERAYTGPPSMQSRVTSPALDDFQRRPTFVNFAKLLTDSGIGFSRFGFRPGDGPKERILREVRGLHEEEAQSDYHPGRYAPGTAADVIRARAETRKQAAEIWARGAHERTCGVLLDDSDYPFFVEKLIKAAATRIRIIMFFMRFEDASKYPTDALFAELLAAKKRDVDIRIILDRDAEGSSIRARVINEEAHAFLSKHGIPVVYDSTTRYTHTKLVTVDRSHVVLGSHNWTAGSFFAYDDTSVYLRSAALAGSYDSHFDEIWKQYGGAQA